jgi:UDP-N-acetylmuramyl pentapeptide phosphotransferase/UDP-N-acetylglucosamine-1-phosphate transferase
MLVVFGVAFASAFLLTPLAERICWRFGLVDKPRQGELQVKPAARAGGYAIILAFLVGFAVSLAFFDWRENDWTRLFAFLAGLALLVPLALADDVKRLGPRVQLAGQVLIATVPVAFGLLIDSVANPFGGVIPLPLVVAVPFTILWIVGMINTMNWIDTMDGLVAGVTAIAALVLFVRSTTLGQYGLAILSLALAAGCLGFLPFNFAPARVFAGSGGSYFIGYSLAVLSIIGGAKIATALLALGLPILDVAVVIVLRLLAGRSPFKGGDNAHLVHRLASRGVSTRRIALMFYTVSVLTSSLAFMLSGPIKLYLFGVVGLLFVVATLLLAVRTRRATPG